MEQYNNWWVKRAFRGELPGRVYTGIVLCEKEESGVILRKINYEERFL